MLFALIAVSRRGKDCIILDCATDGTDPLAWEREFEVAGSTNPIALGFEVPQMNGIYEWEGDTDYDEESKVVWVGEWRGATLLEIKKFLQHKNVWKPGIYPRRLPILKVRKLHKQRKEEMK